jgi:1-acyl-sn-glycerol-3-phosphate acyltransferase
MRFVIGIISYLWKFYIGVMFVTTLFLLYPILVFCIYIPSLKHYTFSINVFWSRSMRMLCFYALEIEDNSEKTQAPFILCANHTSYLDIFLMYSTLPNHKFLFMGKSEILSYPLLKTFFKNLNIPVFRGDRLKAARSFIRARNEIAQGWSIVIFPEGGIPYQTPFLMEFKDGAFKLAKSAKVGVLPLTFENNYHLFSDPEELLGLAHPGLAKITIHPFITKETVELLSEKELNDRTFNAINSCLPQPN